MIAFLPAAAYFWVYWPVKHAGRRAIHIGALAYLSASFLFLVAEVILEIRGPRSIADILRSVKEPSTVYFLQGGFIVATLLIFSHHLHELRHRRSTYVFGDSLWALLEGRGQYEKEEEFVRFGLPLVFQAFIKYGAQSVCIWRPDGASMRIP